MKPRRDGRVRCSAWLGGMVSSLHAALDAWLGTPRPWMLWLFESLYLRLCIAQLRLELFVGRVKSLYLRSQVRKLRAQARVLRESFEDVVDDFESGDHNGVMPPNDKVSDPRQ